MAFFWFALRVWLLSILMFLLSNCCIVVFTQGGWDGPPRKHLEHKFLAWTKNLALGMLLWTTAFCLFDSCGHVCDCILMMRMYRH